MTPELITTLKEFSPLVVAIIIFVWYLDRQGKRSQSVMQSTTTLISNHMEHDIETTNKLTSALQGFVDSNRSIDESNNRIIQLVEKLIDRTAR